MTHDERAKFMKDLIHQARVEGRLLEGSNTVFTPDELEEYVSEQKFIWANLGNWQLLSPEVYLNTEKERLKRAQDQYTFACAKVDRFRAEMELWRKGREIIVAKLGSPVWVKVPSKALPGWTMCMLHPEDQRVYRADAAVEIGVEEVYVMVNQTW